MSDNSWHPYAAGDGNFDTMHTWTGDGDPNRTFEINFTGGYISQSDVKAFMIRRGTNEQVDLRVTFVNANTVKLNRAVPPDYDVTIYRDTPKDRPSTSFIDGALITADNLERNAKQAIFGVAELADRNELFQGVVNDALGKAESAENGIKAIRAVADNALQVADDANTASRNAVTKANSANARVGEASGKAQDALDLANEAIEIANSHVSDPDNVKRVVRAPAGEVLSELPAKELRAGKGLSFDVNGDIVAVTPVEGSAEAVLQSLRQQNGLSHIGLAWGTQALDTAIKYLSFEMFGAKSGVTQDQSAAIQATINAATELGLPIWSTGQYFVQGQIRIESPVQITGASFLGPSSTTGQRFNCFADATFDWCKFDKVGIYHGGGNLLVSNFQILNNRSTAAVFSEKLPEPCTLELRYGTFRNCYFGYLRQGAPGSSAPLRTNIVRGVQFFDMQADCIEMNLATGDGYTLVENVVIDVVDHLGTQPNWGIAMGFAGQGNYEITDNYTNFFKNLTLRNCRVYAARQCIHIEKGYNCLIENVELYPDNTRSTNAGIETAGIVLYGCTNVQIKGVRGRPLNGSRMVWVSWGITAGQYKSAGRDITIHDVDVAGSVDVNMATTDAFESYLDMRDVRCDSLSIVGHASRYDIADVQAKDITVEFHRVSNDGRDSVRRMNRCVGRFDNVRSSTVANTGATLGRIAVDELSVTNTNFPIRKTASSVTNRGTPLTKIDGTYFLESASFPWGYWFLPGDRIVNQSGTVYTILTEGCQFKSQGDTLLRAAAAGTDTLQGRGTENWTTVYYKTAGCKVVIPKGGPNGTDLHTSIVRSAWIAGGIYTIKIADKLSTAIVDGTVLQPEAVCTYTTK
ncbi:colanic acid degradation [Cronobacter phage Dev-CD-23823]|uniref:Tail fiber protein n=1 Tax=Cronobacter phage Dev-CD-23823 TaxID=1712539 RepID=A0A0K8IXP4_9CAUD|nr:colanic acid degradation [Cronobacter phage Dev-CD-23823]CUH74616.1 Tail fiber protein [Cronobacter phage Dev-CD-23823]